MLVQNLKSDMAKQIRILSYTCSHHVLCIIALITNDGFPSRDIGCPKTNVTHENACHFVNFNAIVFIFQI